MTQTGFFGAAFGATFFCESAYTIRFFTGGVTVIVW